MSDLIELKKEKQVNEIFAFVEKGQIYIGDGSCIVRIGNAAHGRSHYDEWLDGLLKKACSLNRLG